MKRTSARRIVLAAIVLVASAATAVGAGICGDPDAEPTSTSDAALPATETMTTTDDDGSPTAISTDVATPPTTNAPKLAQFPTPSSAADTMVIGGSLWIDARPATGEVVASIDGQPCGIGQSGQLPDDNFPLFVIEIASASEQPGCGTPGAAVTIMVNGRAMNETIVWQPGFQQQVNLIAGPPFASYYGELTFDGIPPPFTVLPYVDGVLCGEDRSAMARLGGRITYHVLVDPQGLQAGCGQVGKMVTLQLEVEGQADVVLDVVPWETDALVHRPTVDLSGRIDTAPIQTAVAAQ